MDVNSSLFNPENMECDVRLKKENCVELNGVFISIKEEPLDETECTSFSCSNLLDPINPLDCSNSIKVEVDDNLNHFCTSNADSLRNKLNPEVIVKKEIEPVLNSKQDNNILTKSDPVKNNLNQFSSSAIDPLAETETVGFSFVKVEGNSISETGENAHSNELGDEQYEDGVDKQIGTESGKNIDEAISSEICKSRRKKKYPPAIESAAEKSVFKCEHCPEEFTKKSCLKYHVAKSHIFVFSDLNQVEKIRHNCKICSTNQKTNGTAWRRKKELNGKESVPKKSSSENEKYSCQVCGKKYVYKNKLTEHMKSHGEYRPHQCPVCPSAFKKSATLEDHMRCHDEIRPFQCPICSNTFKRRSHYYAHMKGHTKPLPHQCPFCPSSYRLEKTLKKHMKRHSEIWLHTCIFCPSKFKRNYDLKQHLKSHEEAQMP